MTNAHPTAKIRRPLSAAGILELVRCVQETGVQAEVSSRDVTITISPAKTENVNPADLIEP